MSSPRLGSGHTHDAPPSRPHTFDEEFDWALEDILARDPEITRDLPAVDVTVAELREGVLAERGAIEAALLPETNRLQAMRNELDATERLGTKASKPSRTGVAQRAMRWSGLVLLGALVLGIVFGALEWYLLAGVASFVSGAALLLILGLVVASLVDRLVDWWSSDRQERESRLYLLRRQVRSEEGIWRQALRDKGIKPVLRELVNAATPNHETAFRVREVAGLAELQDSSFEVRTAALAELESLVATLPGGSIGVSGPRGMGKTTLLRRFCSDEFHTSAEADGKAPVRVLLSAPVRYDAREFVLHLFTTVCLSLTGPTRRTPAVKGAGSSGAMLAVALWSVAALAFLSSVWGAVLVLGHVRGWSDPADLQPAIVWVLIGLVVFSASMFLRVLVAGDTARNASDRSADPEDSVVATAERLLVGLAYQQSFASGWSGSLTLPVGASVGFSTNTTMTEKPMSFPELVQRLNDFLRMVAQERQVFIGIDELDKIDAEGDATRFINDIKGLFGHAHCFYLVSISQNAMSAFERRGLPLRDAFDSAFDVVVEVDYLDLDESERLLRRRVIGMPVGFLWLCHVLSGGLPRDLIRSAREVVECARAAPSGELSEVTPLILRRDVCRKVRALRVAAHDLAAEPEIGLFVAQLDVLAERLQDDGDLRASIHDALSLVVAPPASAGTGHGTPPFAALGLFRIELAAYLYFVSAVLDFFGEYANAMRIAESDQGPRGVRRLARARQAFAFSPRSAWADVSAFRAAWNLATLDFPERLYGGGTPAAEPFIAQPAPERVNGGLERVAGDGTGRPPDRPV